MIVQRLALSIGNVNWDGHEIPISIFQELVEKFEGELGHYGLELIDAEIGTVYRLKDIVSMKVETG